MADDASSLMGPDRCPAVLGSTRPEVVGIEGRHAELTVEQILAWADAHHAAKGNWPTHDSGRVRGAARS